MSASQTGSDSDLRSLVTTMQSEITRLKALLDAKPAAPPATASAEAEVKKEESGGEDEDREEDESEEEDDEEEEGAENHETPPPKGKPPAETSVAKSSKKPKGPNSSTHRAQWMKFGRRMESQGSEFPEMTISCGPEPKTKPGSLLS